MSHEMHPLVFTQTLQLDVLSWTLGHYPDAIGLRARILCGSWTVALYCYTLLIHISSPVFSHLAAGGPRHTPAEAQAQEVARVRTYVNAAFAIVS